MVKGPGRGLQGYRLLYLMSMLKSQRQTQRLNSGQSHREPPSQRSTPVQLAILRTKSLRTSEINCLLHLAGTKSFPWQWILAISAAIGFIYLVTLEPGNNTKSGSVRTPSPSTAPAKSQSSGHDLPQDRSLQSIELPTEQKPPPGMDNVLNAAQIRYCLSENIRLEGAESVLNSYIAAEVDRYNLMIEDFNSRCAKFRYKQSTMESIQLHVNSNRSSLLAEGIGLFHNTQESKSLSTPRSQISKR